MPGWQVIQPKPGWHQWQTPSGRVYIQKPWRYTVNTAGRRVGSHGPFGISGSGERPDRPASGPRNQGGP